jgi:hypothetical protein
MEDNKNKDLLITNINKLISEGHLLNDKLNHEPKSEAIKNVILLQQLCNKYSKILNGEISFSTDKEKLESIEYQLFPALLLIQD